MKRVLKQILKSESRQENIFEDVQSFREHTPNAMSFCTGMGRSGTHFMAKLFQKTPGVEAYHMDHIGNSAADSFFQYAKWYELDVDQTPLFSSRSFLSSRAAALKNEKYFESNPYLNLHIRDLSHHFDCKILIIYRDPKKVVESHYNKGWYHDFQPEFDASTHGAPGYEYSIQNAHHFFGRFYPKDANELDDWKSFSRVGKIAWMWSAVYKKILEDTSVLSNVRIVRTEEIDYEKYGEICDFLELGKTSAEVFQGVLESKPGKAAYKKLPEWTSVEVDEFTTLTDGILQKLENHLLKL
ncbi:MAG: hypothetical protein F6K11_17710 [Leptolyngbya sp. SIO3F4]|nr:hypothetical protein [Leptolyngbya sp. SIO3F4]